MRRPSKPRAYSYAVSQPVSLSCFFKIFSTAVLLYATFEELVYVQVAVGWIPVLLTLRARRENGYTTVWDLASGTRVVVMPKLATERPDQREAAVAVAELIAAQA